MPAKAAAPQPRPTPADVRRFRRPITTAVTAVLDVVKTDATVEARTKELAIMRRAAKHALEVQDSPDELAAMRAMELRSKGNFTRQLGTLIMRTGISPLEFLIREMRDATNAKELRIRCAVDALPYIHGKVANEVKVNSNQPGTTVNFVNVQQTQVEKLTDEELEQLSALAEKLRPPIDVDGVEVHSA